MVPTTYHFSDYVDKCVSLNITVYHFKWYPLGGTITVFPPRGAPSFAQKPGEEVKTHYPPGEWKWCAKDADAIGVDVFQ